jgi:hypothetical protein
VYVNIGEGAQTSRSRTHMCIHTHTGAYTHIQSLFIAYTTHNPTWCTRPVVTYISLVFENSSQTPVCLLVQRIDEDHTLESHFGLVDLEEFVLN